MFFNDYCVKFTKRTDTLEIKSATKVDEATYSGPTIDLNHLCIEDIACP